MLTAIRELTASCSAFSRFKTLKWQRIWQETEIPSIHTPNAKTRVSERSHGGQLGTDKFLIYQKPCMFLQQGELKKKQNKTQNKVPEILFWSIKHHTDKISSTMNCSSSSKRLSSYPIKAQNEVILNLILKEFKIGEVNLPDAFVRGNKSTSAHELIEASVKDFPSWNLEKRP